MTLSPLERLPAELIQSIFLFSACSLALVDASHYVAAKLADPHIYYALCAHYLTQEHDPEQVSAQERIFNSKWMTWEFFKSFVLRFYGPEGCLCGKAIEEGCRAGYVENGNRIWPPDFENATRMEFHLGHRSSLASITCRIPLRLLRGSWTQEMTEFVRFIMWTTNMKVDARVGPAVVEAWKRAIMERNLEVAEIFNHDPRLNKVNDLSILRFAVMEAGCDRSIVYDILSKTPQSAWRLEGRVHPTLYEWCEREIKEGNPKAKWLQTKLRELRGTSGYSIKRYGDLCPKMGDYDGGENDVLVINKHAERHSPYW